jgi:acyl-coenzyme A thioesterase PaaI-like protein
VECLKIGRNVVFAEVTFRKTDGSIIAKGKHTLSKLNHLKTNGEFVRQ